MKKHTLIPILIAIALFFVPFFWLKAGFVDLGGDGGRFYFVDPLAWAMHTFKNQTAIGASLYAFIPFDIMMSIIHRIIPSPTRHIAFDQGIVLSLAFYSFYLVIVQLCLIIESKKGDFVDLAAMSAAAVYVGCIAKNGWATSLVSYYQFFLNPLIFYLILRFFLTYRLYYAGAILFVTLMYSGNFGYSSMPQLVAFFPMSLLYLVVIFRWVLHKQIAWKYFFGIGLIFFLLHAFHLIPMIASIFGSGTMEQTRIFSKSLAKTDGVYYFDSIRQQLGKISEAILWPAFIVPCISIFGFIIKRSRSLALTGGFFALTLYLVAANVNLIGAKLYRLLFYIPGFLMFRSFNDKWYAAFAFFYCVLFGLSFYYVLQKRSRTLVGVLIILVIGSVVINMAPFLAGSFYKSTLYKSQQVPVVFEMDRNLMDAISFTRQLPDDGHVLTLPLTLPYYQVIYGRTTGAYVGISLVNSLADKKDYSGLWSFGVFQAPLELALTKGDTTQVLQIISLLGARYIFRDTDTRIMTDFPTYPYYRFDRTIDIPSIDSQDSYDELLANYPLTTLYEKGFFRIQKFEDSVIRPTVYIPDIIYASVSDLVNGSSFRSGYADADTCLHLHCGVSDKDLPLLTFHRTSNELYSVDIETGNRIAPFLIVLSEDYDPSWSLGIQGAKPQHVRVNGFANGWIVDPKQLSTHHVSGVMTFGFQKYFKIGRVISIATLILLSSLGLYSIVRGKPGK